jgi:uncharacterized protein (TIGR01244 family)
MFRKLTDTVLVSPQISVEDVAQAKAAGVTFILNNRPEGESPDQTPGDAIEAAAKATQASAMLRCRVNHSGFAPWQLDGMDAALGEVEGRRQAARLLPLRHALDFALGAVSRPRR